MGDRGYRPRGAVVRFDLFDLVILAGLALVVGVVIAGLVGWIRETLELRRAAARWGADGKRTPRDW